jgi:hypothetical protein
MMNRWNMSNGNNAPFRSSLGYDLTSGPDKGNCYFVKKKVPYPFILPLFHYYAFCFVAILILNLSNFDNLNILHSSPP